jgi:hypothetical protein
VRAGAGRGLRWSGWRWPGRKVHSGAGVPPVVTVHAWTVRGRKRVQCRDPWRVTTVAAACACVSLLYWLGSWQAACRVRCPEGDAAAGGGRVKVMYEHVAGIDVHKDMIKVAVRSPGDKPWTRKTEILSFRTFFGVLRAMARELRRRV